MKRFNNKRAYSLLELIFVIVILGIIASMGSQMIVGIYGQYIVQRGQHRASLKTELAALQIANRLSMAIPGTIFRRNATTGGTIESVNDAMSLAGDSYIALQWVGADVDSFNATATPGWSGFCDVDASSGTVISTPGSDLDKANDIMLNLAAGTLPPNSPSLYFPYDAASYPTASLAGGTDAITLNTAATHIVEHYKLAWSSYALVVDNNNDLYLHYNFDPTPEVAIGAKRSLIMKDITTFKFKGAGRTIRFKICKEEQIGEDFNITACKEKAVF